MVDHSMSFEDLMRHRHAEIALFIVNLNANPVGDPRDYASPEGRELLRQHFIYWWELEERGLLLGAGPVNVGTPQQSGMAILIARSRAEAERLATNEPLHKVGWRVNTVHAWQLNEGLGVRFVLDHLAIVK